MRELANRLSVRMRGLAATGHTQAWRLRQKADALDRAVVLGDRPMVVEVNRARRLYRQLRGGGA